VEFHNDIRRDDARQSSAANPSPMPLAEQASDEESEHAAYEMAVSLGHAALAKKGEDILLLDVRALTILADYFLLVTGKNRVHIRALCDAVEEEARKAGRRARRTEGIEEGHWVLLDFGDVIVHLFTEEERSYYQLERLWGDAPRELIEDDSGDPEA